MPSASSRRKSGFSPKRSRARNRRCAVRIPDREGEHAAQVVDDVRSPVLVGAQQHLGVGVAREAVADGLQALAQLAEVVDLAVEREREARGVVAHRLRRAHRVDDGQAPVAEEDARAVGGGVLARAVAVGSAMLDRVQHARERCAVHGARGIDDGSGDSAHGSTPSCRRLGAGLCAPRRPGRRRRDGSGARGRGLQAADQLAVTHRELSREPLDRIRGAHAPAAGAAHPRELARDRPT